MKHLKNFSIFKTSKNEAMHYNDVKIQNIKIGTLVRYQGTPYKVVDNNDYILYLKNDELDMKTKINQGQLNQYGLWFDDVETDKKN